MCMRSQREWSNHAVCSRSRILVLSSTYLYIIKDLFLSCDGGAFLFLLMLHSQPGRWRHHAIIRRKSWKLRNSDVIWWCERIIWKLRKTGFGLDLIRTSPASDLCYFERLTLTWTKIERLQGHVTASKSRKTVSTITHWISSRKFRR